ncbi:MAG: lipopolysaccharide transport periplasmic protein LptA [Roseobacter sp.]
MTLLRLFLLPSLILTFATSLAAQGTQVAFGTIQQNSGLPVEVTADSLSVDQTAGTALFSDNVLIVQGEMRLSADNVLVTYDSQAQGIDRIEATGNVILVSGQDAAESARADYNVDDGTILMSGNVLVTQGPAVLTSDAMTVRLDDGTAQMSGRVKTVLQTGNN